MGFAASMLIITEVETTIVIVLDLIVRKFSD
jgi:hypothetical protein